MSAKKSKALDSLLKGSIDALPKGEEIRGNEPEQKDAAEKEQQATADSTNANVNTNDNVQADSTSIISKYTQEPEKKESKNTFQDTHRLVGIYLPNEMAEKLDDYALRFRDRTSKSQMVQDALRMFFEALEKQVGNA